MAWFNDGRASAIESGVPGKMARSWAMVRPAFADALLRNVV
jgi:hypothetical protein